MNDQNQSGSRRVRIVHRADGGAEVDGVEVTVAPGQDVRDAAYRAAVRLVAGADGPVAATRVEADGAEYPLMLYPFRTPVAAHADGGRVRHGGRRRLRTTPGLGWLVAAAGVCMLVTALVTSLLRQPDPVLMRLAVDRGNAGIRTGAAESAGAAMAESARRGLVAAGAAGASLGLGTGAATQRTRGPARSAASPRPSAASGLRAAAAGAVAERSPARPAPAAGVSPTPKGSASARPLEVTAVTLSLSGGDKGTPGFGYVVDVTTTSTGPVTVTYTYWAAAGAGNAHPAAVTGSVVIAGRTEYVLADSVPGRSYCGQTVTVRVTTTPAAQNGAVSATTALRC